MKRLLLILCLLLPSISFAGDGPLTKELIKTLQGAMSQLEGLENKFPSLKEQDMNESMFDTKKQLALIEAAGATSEVERVVKAAGFDDIESFLGYTQRMMSSMFAVMKEQMPGGMDMQAMIQQQESALAAMKSSGMPEAALQQMIQGIEEMKQQALRMQKAAGHAQPADVSFMRENFGWIMQQFDANMG